VNDRKYRKYTREFKVEALSLAENSDKSLCQIEQELDVTPGLSSWFPSLTTTHSWRELILGSTAPPLVVHTKPSP
jgi:transposase-like protein